MDSDTYHAQYSRKRWQNDEEYRLKRLADAKAWRERNKEALKEKRRKYLAENAEKLAADRKANRAAVNARLRERRATDLNYRLTELLRNRLRREIKKCGGAKVGDYSALLGCDIDALRAHIEKQFTDGMTWANHGDWHIDHVKACSLFDLTDPEQQAVCFHYTNLQPLWALDNIKKGGSRGKCRKE